MFKRWRKQDSVFDVNEIERSSREHSLIAGSLHIMGDVKFAGTLRVDGRIDGKVSLQSGQTGVLIVSKEATINGPVTTTDLIIDGTILGNVRADGRVECRGHATVKGEVQYGTLHISEGAVVEGRYVQAGKAVETPRSRRHGVIGQDDMPEQERNVTFLSKEKS